MNGSQRSWALPFTVAAYYFVTEVGMTPLELVLVGTVMELSVFLFEIPTGIVADTTSRRLSIVIGNVVKGLAFVVVGVYVGVWPVLLGYASGVSAGPSRAARWTRGSPTRSARTP